MDALGLRFRKTRTNTPPPQIPLNFTRSALVKKQYQVAQPEEKSIVRPSFDNLLSTLHDIRKDNMDELQTKSFAFGLPNQKQPFPQPKENVNKNQRIKRIGDILNINEEKQPPQHTDYLKQELIFKSIAENEFEDTRLIKVNNTGPEIAFYADLSDTTRKMANLRKQKEIVIQSGNASTKFSEFRDHVKFDVGNFCDDQIDIYEVIDIALSRIPKVKLGRKIRNRPRITVQPPELVRANTVEEPGKPPIDIQRNPIRSTTEPPLRIFQPEGERRTSDGNKAPSAPKDPFQARMSVLPNQPVVELKALQDTRKLPATNQYQPQARETRRSGLVNLLTVPVKSTGSGRSSKSNISIASSNKHNINLPEEDSSSSSGTCLTSQSQSRISSKSSIALEDRERKLKNKLLHTFLKEFQRLQQEIPKESTPTSKSSRKPAAKAKVRTKNEWIGGKKYMHEDFDDKFWQPLK